MGKTGIPKAPLIRRTTQNTGFVKSARYVPMPIKDLDHLTLALRSSTFLDMKNPHAQALGRLGGLARAKKLTDDERLAISKYANKIKKKRAQIQRDYNNRPHPGEDQ